jgi:hypothetical protein
LFRRLQLRERTGAGLEFGGGNEWAIAHFLFALKVSYFRARFCGLQMVFDGG